MKRKTKSKKSRQSSISKKNDDVDVDCMIEGGDIGVEYMKDEF